MNDDFLVERLAEARAESEKKAEKLVNFHYLAGYYGAKAEHSGNAELRALVAEMRAVLGGTWDSSVMTK